ncbi:glycoside hydrolase family 2 protein [Mucilaginibacter sp.]|uniref:glycoside hydrolase family 2 protein n=1 Tax=Mucilaginibacter sp. TaxID=1882438 RepID=UPI002C8BDB94|nr:glycoside hydrolase family 2 protein [Mucilaginibacter sp.]HTI60432.1 glycoside hydrolase family 2 protein [Mucilaginibacter sp.]
MKRFSLMIILSSLFVYQSFAQTTESHRMILKDGWQMQSVTKDASPGSAISQTKFVPKGWYKVTVPTTIIAGLLANKVYDFDPFMGMNFEKLKDPALDKPWWFRKAFAMPPGEKGKTVILKLHGINYKANIWLNGTKIADSTETMGPFRIIEMDVTKYIKATGSNVLALEIKRPVNPNHKGGDLAIDYADWIHYPPDYNGGIVNDIEIKTFDKVGIQYPLVTTNFDLPSLAIAHLTVDALVTNYSKNPQDVVVKGKINSDIAFEKKVHLGPNEIANVTFTPTEFTQLNISNPKIWWPWQYGKPELNHIELSIAHGSAVSNTIAENFGIRQITSKLIDDMSREFIVNGKPIMLRGAAWSPDIFQRRSPERQEQELRLYRDMNMNIVRSEGKLEDDHFYALCDKYGLLVMTGWMCCGAWQYPENWDKAKRIVAMQSDSSVMYWLRNKPSIMVWLNGSDMPPRDTTVERDYLNIEAALKWPNPTISTANESKSKVSGFSGVKMAGPYEWVPPIYWETDTTSKFGGGTWSFATEISPGPSIPPYESLIKFIPKDSLWYNTKTWDYHCGTMTFGNTRVFNEALENRYGKPLDIKQYIAEAQAQNYEAHRAMMEGYGLHKYNTATGVVQWMGSNPWPGLIWHTYDYYLYPAGTYFGMKKSMEPLHIMYSYANNEVDIINSLLTKFNGLQAEATIFNLDGTQKYTNTATVDVDADGTAKCFALPAASEFSDTYFLRLQLTDDKGTVHSVNWYWLSKKGDVLNWKKSKWYTTPETSYTDYTALQSLGKTSLKVSYYTDKKADSTYQAVTIANTGKTVAFQVHLRALKGQRGDDILPVIFSDNYIELAPGESRVIRVSYANKDAKGTMPYLLTTAWNLDIGTSQSDNQAGFAAN